MNQNCFNLNCCIWNDNRTRSEIQRCRPMVTLWTSTTALRPGPRDNRRCNLNSACSVWTSYRARFFWASQLRRRSPLRRWLHQSPSSAWRLASPSVSLFHQQEPTPPAVVKETLIWLSRRLSWPTPGSPVNQRSNLLRRSQKSTLHLLTLVPQMVEHSPVSSPRLAPSHLSRSSRRKSLKRWPFFRLDEIVF